MRSSTRFPCKLPFTVVTGLTLLTVLGATAAIAQTVITLTPENPTARVTGFVRGNFSLTAKANKDRANNVCLGYGSEASVPDHQIVLPRDRSNLDISVESQSGQNMTLFIEGPEPGVFWCGDSRISDITLPKGTYSVWVGVEHPGNQTAYSLVVR